MNYEEDWLMRQIKIMVDFAYKLIKSGDMGSKSRQELGGLNLDKLSLNLDNLLRDKDINEAENILFSKIDVNKLAYLKIGLDFYDRINRLSDEELRKADFSREEIEMGIKDLFDTYGINYLR